jgi:tungstate transport system ATP-binding protein
VPAKRSLLFQRPTMLRRSAAANIRYALRSAKVPRDLHNARIEQLLDQVGLDGLGERPARRMSNGEQQRLALARALAREPTVLFLDEPTASLDPAATKAVEEVIRIVAERGIKIVMSTHDLGEARRLAGDVVLLHRGRVVEHAPVAAFFSAPRTSEARAFLAGELLL